jgi:hypothetical protein
MTSKMMRSCMDALDTPALRLTHAIELFQKVAIDVSRKADRDARTVIFG